MHSCQQAGSLGECGGMQLVGFTGTIIHIGFLWPMVQGCLPTLYPHASVEPRMHRHLLSNYWTTSCQLERACLASFQGLPHFFFFRFVFNIIVLNDCTELKPNANQFQSHMPRVGRSQIAQDLVVNGMRLNVPLLYMWYASGLADNFASVIYTVGS